MFFLIGPLIQTIHKHIDLNLYLGDFKPDNFIKLQCKREGEHERKDWEKKVRESGGEEDKEGGKGGRKWKGVKIRNSQREYSN